MLPRIGICCPCEKRFKQYASRRSLLTPIRGFSGRSAICFPGARIRTSRGSSRQGSQNQSSPSHTGSGTSLALCTAQSNSPPKTFSSRSRVKKSAGLSRRSVSKSRSPGEVKVTSSKRQSGNSDSSLSNALRVCIRASSLLRVPTLKCTSFIYDSNPEQISFRPLYPVAHGSTTTDSASTSAGLL